MPFINPYKEHIHCSLKDILLWKLGYHDETLESCVFFNYSIYQRQASLSNPCYLLGISFDQLAVIHLTLISHDHYDKPTTTGWFNRQEIFLVYQSSWWQ